MLLPDGVRLTRIRDNGTVFARGTRCHVNRTLFGDVVTLVETEAPLQVFDESGTLFIEHPWGRNPAQNMSAAADRKGLAGHAHAEKCRSSPC